MGNQGNYIFKGILRGIKDLIKHLSDTMYFFQFLAFHLLSRFLYLNGSKIEISCRTFILGQTKMLSLYIYIIPSVIWFSLLILNPFSCKFIDGFITSPQYLARNGSNQEILGLFFKLLTSLADGKFVLPQTYFSYEIIIPFLLF